MGVIDQTKVSVENLRWQCDPQWITVDDSSQVKASDEIIGQDQAKEAILFGIQCHGQGQNIYVRGNSGSGRMTLVRQLLQQQSEQHTSDALDRCYVHNFKRPEKPRLISLPAATASNFKQAVKAMAHFVTDNLNDALNSDTLLNQRAALQSGLQEQIDKIKAPLNDELKAANMALVALQNGQMTQQAIFALVDGQPIAPDKLQQMVAQGEVEQTQLDQFEIDHKVFQQRLHSMSRDINSLIEDTAKQAIKLNEDHARLLLSRFGDRIKKNHEGQSVSLFVDEIINDVIDNRIKSVDESHDPKSLYDVNIVIQQKANSTPAVVIENTPNLANLLGTVDAQWNARGPVQLDYRGIHAGSLLRADGGYLIIDVKDIVSDAGAWRALIRTLRTGVLEIVPSQSGPFGGSNVLKPDPIKIRVRVILIGDMQTYYMLDKVEADFSDMFKILADFDNEIIRDQQGVSHYVQVIASMIKKNNAPAFDKGAIAQVIEHGARVVARRNKLTANFSRIADIIQEAAFLSKQAQADIVSREHVQDAIKRRKARASMPSRKFQELLTSGTINVMTNGEQVGQINGLAVINSGPITYGFPSRITATIGPGHAGLINIEGQASMSGSIHTKGFSILGGLLRYILKTDHPMAFSASIAFEQSYGGIDGDSASGAEAVCILSALTGIAIKQSVAMTGAIDQHGRIQAIGGVNEKIEGFFDVCAHEGLNHGHMVIIPKANEGDLMLREDVVKACEEGKFCVHAVSTIQEALEIATGLKAGEYIVDDYEASSLLKIARDRAKYYWQISTKSSLSQSNNAQLMADKSIDEQKNIVG